MSAGKGDARRPYDPKKYAENYDRIFRKPKDDTEKRMPKSKKQKLPPV